MLSWIWRDDSSAGAAPGQTPPETIQPWRRSPSMTAERAKRSASSRATVVFPAPGMPLTSQTSAIDPIVSKLLAARHRRRRGWPSLAAADRLVAQGVVGEHQRGHGLHHGHRAGQDTGVVAAPSAEGRVLVVDVHRVLLVHDRRSGLEGHANVDGLAVGDAALDTTAPVGAGADAIATHVELVVVLAPGEVGAREARADLETLAGGQAQEGLGEVGLEAIEDGLTPARRAAAHRAAHRAAQRIAVLARGLHRLDHLRGLREVGAANGRPVDPLARHPLGVGLDGKPPDLRYPGHHLHAPARGQELARDGAGGHASGRLAGAGAAPASPVADAELGVVGVIGVARPVLLPDLAVVAGSHVLVGDHEADRRAEGLALEDA